MGRLPLIRRWLFLAILLAANLVLAGTSARGASADFSPCSQQGHCNCFDDGSGPYCSHVMGQNDPCENGFEC